MDNLVEDIVILNPDLHFDDREVRGAESLDRQVEDDLQHKDKECCRDTKLEKPKPLIAKLDPELGVTGPEWAPVTPRDEA